MHLQFGRSFEQGLPTRDWRLGTRKRGMYLKDFPNP
jgi:hypothetical protein